MAMNAVEYASPLGRQLNRDPMGALAQVLGGLASARGPGDLASTMDSQAFVGSEGYEDGQTLVKTHKCNTWTLRGARESVNRIVQERHSIAPAPDDRARFVAALHPQYRRIKGITAPPATPARGARFTEACEMWMSDSRSSASEKAEFCRCLARATDTGSVSDNDMDLITLSFTTEGLSDLKKRYPRFQQASNACYR
jgi:hypothetical protein